MSILKRDLRFAPVWQPSKEIKKIEAEIMKTVNVFQEGNDLFEIRILDKKNAIQCGYYKPAVNVRAMLGQIDTHKLYNGSIYMTLQKIGDVSTIDRCHVIMPTRFAIKDEDISAYRFIHIDLDPVRPSDTQATDEEMKHAEVMMYEIERYLAEQGFKQPILSFSGNGYNLDYKVDLPNTKENVALIKSVLRTLSDKFSNEYVNVDKVTYNPSRIIKLYGCISCKGENTPERPYRYSKILRVPENIEITERSVIESFVEAHKSAVTPKSLPATQASPATKTKLTARIGDVPKWLDSYNLNYDLKKEDDRTLYVLGQCPFNPEHVKSSFVQVFEDGNVFFKCHHNSCSEHHIREVLEMFPIQDRQIPLMDASTDAALLFNAVGDRVKLIIDQNKKKYLQYDGITIAFASSKTEAIVRKIGQSIGQLPPDSLVKRIISNVESHYEDIPSADRKIVGTRIVSTNKGIVYACGRADYYLIGNGGVTSCLNDKICFVSTEGAMVQVKPDLSINPDRLPDLVRQCFHVNEDSLLRFMAQLVSLYIPNISSPILVLSGAQGTSKTTTSKMIKSLVDPNEVNVVATPDREDGLTTILSSNYLTVFDNAERINPRFSDLLAISCTGGFTSRRKLYTDSDVSAINLRSKIIINGIGDIIARSDLAERCNTIYLDSIEVRRTETDVWNEFNKLKPMLLGAIFNTLSLALPLVADMKIKYEHRLPRMAEFCVYGAAIIKAIRLDDEAFVLQYTNSTNEGVNECNEADELLGLIKSYLGHIEGHRWSGRPQDLLMCLKDYAKENKKTVDDRLTASSLSRRLGQNQAALKNLGIEFQRDKSGADRTITLRIVSDTYGLPPIVAKKLKKPFPEGTIDDDLKRW